LIQYSLICENDHKFEAWFRNVAAYDEQCERGIVTCPICATHAVHKALMAPAVAKSSRSDTVSLSIGHPEHARIRAMMRQLREKVVSEADYVGSKFAEEARKIHFKEVEAHGIYGEATREEVAGLVEDGVDFMPLPNLPEEQN
jgi:hypothetical protein